MVNFINVAQRMAQRIVMAAVVSVSFSMNVLADEAADEAADLASWVALDAPTGHEHWATGPLMKALKGKGWRVDKTGNMLKTTGSGGQHRVVACALDAHSFAVSQITDKGYLRLHHIGRPPRNKLWSQAHVGQHVRIITRQGPVVGVTAASNGHFVNLHRHETAIVRADDLWVDVGASSAAEVAEMGINLLDPMIRQLPAWNYAGEVAGPSSGARVGCAAVVAGAESGSVKGKTTWVLSTQSTFSLIGLSSAIAGMKMVDEVILLGKGTKEGRHERAKGINGRVDNILFYAGVSKITAINPKVKNVGGLMERVSVSTANDLFSSVMLELGVTAGKPQWVAAPKPMAVLNADPKRLGGGEKVAAFEALLDQLAETSAVFGHEGPIRKIVMDNLPPWAKALVQTDEIGNVWVDVGPKDKQATFFMAHMDEVGYEVSAIGDDGIVSLARKGGAINQLWEGQPALLQLDANKGIKSLAKVDSIKGVFLPRQNPTEKVPLKVEAWFGMDGKGLAAVGVKVGMAVTGYKEGHRLGKYRYAARGMDDRVGTTALLFVIKEIDPKALKHRVIFAFSTQEEGGLHGATALAKRYGAETKRIYSIDTFVSSDTPLESPHFAYAPLGNGPVLRSIENSGMAIPFELDRNRAIAKKAGINVQIGQTQGGTDGTVFAFWGAPNAGLSWPGRYSHGPAEIADLRDATKLVQLIKAFALANPE